MRFKLCAVSALAFLAVGAGAENTPPWMNTSLSPDARADLVQAKMTRDEELVLVDGVLGVAYQPGHRKPLTPELKAALPVSAGYVPGIPRLGVPALAETDASLGVANGGNMRPGDTSTALPASILTAATWNPDMAFQGGAMIAKEARAKGYNVLLAGGINLAREPRGGRTFEYAGEDPWLAGMIVGESIRGIQSQGMISTIKHYALNAQETARTVMSANISDSDARESDLLAFELAIEKGDPGSVMCAYNRINNVYACESHYLLSEVLKGDWAYKGFVMSDWGAVHSTVQAAINGLDQESSNGSDRADYFGKALKDAVAKGQVPASRLHDMVHRILRAMFAKGLFDKPPVKGPVDIEADLGIAQANAEDGIVLLKNEKSLLPLSETKRQKIAVIGAHADLGVPSGGGSSQVLGIGHSKAMEVRIGGGTKQFGGQVWTLPQETVVFHANAPLDEIKKLSARGSAVDYASGEDIEQAVALAKKSDVAVVFAHQHMHEGADVIDLSLPGNQNDLIAAVAAANPHTIVVLETGGPVTMPWADKVDGIVEAWYAGNRGGAAIARVLFGEVNPSGHLPVTFPITESQLAHPIITGQRPDNRITWTNGTPTAYDVIYNEGSKVGYRWFEDQKLPPLFAFGHGLSYTSFGYSGLNAQGGNGLTVSFDVKNTGTRTGKAVAQVYVKPPYGAVRLVGFAKVELGAGDVKHITLKTDPRLLAMFDSDANLWRVADGDYVVRIGSSSAEQAAVAKVHINASTVKP
ncbi:beta-glucosidase [Rhizomicrobium palustre]|uniref:Beta-glucosidase n=1 Tax=Rhizomicrobium palustre TaxID=189966 RepID=A0A846N1Q5_9PROT|nr:glycoside hydrolase family 3 C-terminal domain-containing protein [Rhizomicrobium palustre]NIK89050.1 beta-glucosidase [Rhizomicrobium palustre]